MALSERNSWSYLQPDDGYIGIAETRGCLHLIYKDECLYLIQTHISKPIGTKFCTHLPRCLEETVVYVWAHNISPFPYFRPFCGKRGATNTHKVAAGAPLPRCCVISVMRHMMVWRHGRDVRGGLCIENAEQERNACVWKWKPDETGRKWLMNCTCNCIAFIQMIT
jgi:hypothetical protein